MPAGRTALAGFLMLPVAFALGGVGEALVGWRPRLAIVLLGIITGLSYFIQQFAPIFRWPDWTLRLSIFTLYVVGFASAGVGVGEGPVGTSVGLGWADSKAPSYRAVCHAVLLSIPAWLGT